MRSRLLLLATLALAGCDRFEAPTYGDNQVIPAEVTRVPATGG